MPRKSKIHPVWKPDNYNPKTTFYVYRGKKFIFWRSEYPRQIGKNCLLDYLQRRSISGLRSNIQPPNSFYNERESVFCDRLASVIMLNSGQTESSLAYWVRRWVWQDDKHKWWMLYDGNEEVFKLGETKY